MFVPGISITPLARSVAFAVKNLDGLVPLAEDVERLRRECMRIWEVIRDADKKPVVDRRQVRWVKDFMDIAYQIEDLVDVFHLEISQNYARKKDRLKWIHKEKQKIKKINDRIREIDAYRETLSEDIGGPNTQPRDLEQPNARNVYLDSHNDGTECIEILATSYYNLPFEMKLCFLYFAAFPKEFEIEARSLLWIWIAERFIPFDERKTLEETAECFLEDLVQRSMIQVSQRSPDGSIKYCWVHDVLRVLAVQKSKEINFLVVCSKPDDWSGCRKARRVAVHYSNDNEPINNYASPNVRSLIFFGKSSKVDCSKYRMLRVLSNMGGEIKLECFRGSPRLRYLQLNAVLNDRDFGEWIRGMKNLETLDLRLSMHDDLSDWIWHVTTLRHVLLSEYYGETLGPQESVHRTNLQTLIGVSWSRLWETPPQSQYMLEVRELGITMYREARRGDESTANLLAKLKRVVYLKIQGVIEQQIIAMERFPFYWNLKSLILINDDYDSNHTLVLGDGMLPPNLTELELGFQFGSDPMPVLEKLERLNTLRIHGTVEIRKNPLTSIWCSAGGFKQLEELVLESLRLIEWKIEIGAMPKLKRLNIRLCPLLRVPSELINLESLEHLTWTVMKTSSCLASLDAIRNIFKQRPHLRGWLKDEFGDFISLDSF